MKQKLLITLAVLITSAVVFAAAKTTFYTILDMTSHRIINVATPTDNADAATKAYADGILTEADTRLQAEAEVLQGEIDAKLPIAGGEMTGSINMGTLNGTKYFINYLHSPTQEYQAVNKKYVQDNFLPLSGGTMTGNINLSGNATVKSVPTPSSSGDAANKDYVDTQDGTKLSLSGGTMTGNLNMGGYKISALNMSSPADGYDVVNKMYVDGATNALKQYTYTQLGHKLSISGGTMMGNINMAGQNTVTGLRTPASGYDAATKQYVDTKIAGVSMNNLSYQYFALRHGSDYPLFFHMTHTNPTNFHMVVLKPFTGRVQARQEGMSVTVGTSYGSYGKEWRVGEEVEIHFNVTSTASVNTNGTVIVYATDSQGMTSAIGNFAVTFPANALPRYNLVVDNVFADVIPPNTPYNLDAPSSAIRIGITNINSTASLTPFHINVNGGWQTYGGETYHQVNMILAGSSMVPASDKLPLSVSAGGCVWIDVVFVGDTYPNGMQWSPYLSYGGGTYSFGPLYAEPGN